MPCLPKARRWSRSSMVNNETGILQPLDRLAPKIREAGSLLLADCAQSAEQISAARCRFHRPVGAQAGRTARASARCWSRILARWSRSAGRRRAIAAGPRTRPARWPSPPRLPPGPMTWTGWLPCARRLDEGVKAAGGVVIGEDSPRLADDRRRFAARRVERLAAGPVRPGRHCGFRRKRLLVGQDEGKRGAGGDGRRARRSPAVSSASASARTRAKPMSTPSLPNGRGSPVAAAARHDLPRLSGDDAGRAGSGGGDAAVDRGEIRQSAQPVALGPRGGGGDRGGARPGRAGARPRRRPLRLHLAARPRR